jgi:uncharacterized DUF497 family protein
MHMRFEWDRGKASDNLRKHGIDFSDAMRAFDDPLSLTIADPDHSETEARYLLLGTAHSGRLVVVAHMEREGNIRIISARLANRTERHAYEEAGS